MNKRHRDKNGRALKFAETGMGRRRYLNIARRNFSVASCLASAISVAEIIKSSRANTKEERILKAASIAQLIINTTQSIYNINRHR